MSSKKDGASSSRLDTTFLSRTRRDDASTVLCLCCSHPREFVCTPWLWTRFHSRQGKESTAEEEEKKEGVLSDVCWLSFHLIEDEECTASISSWWMKMSNQYGDISFSSLSLFLYLAKNEEKNVIEAAFSSILTRCNSSWSGRFLQTLTVMLIITFPSLYVIYGLLIAFVCLSTVLGQLLQSETLLQSLCSACALLSIYLPIFLKYHSPCTQVTDTLVSIFSAVTGFLFALKILELAFTYDWPRQRQITVKQILVDFSTFPKYKYLPEPSKSTSTPTKWTDYFNYLLVDSDAERLSPRRENLLMMLRGCFQLLCLHLLLHYTPYRFLRFHSRDAHWWSPVHFVIYVIYGFIFYFALGMVINLIFGWMGFLWNVRVRSIYPGYPFLPTSLHDFWSRRWNIYVKSILHRLAFIALPKLFALPERSPLRLILGGSFAFLISGLLHEFMYSVSMNRWSGGKNLSFFLIQGLFVAIEVLLQTVRQRRPLVHPVIGWIYTIIALYSTSHLFCDPWIEADCFATLKTHLG